MFFRRIGFYTLMSCCLLYMFSFNSCTKTPDTQQKTLEFWTLQLSPVFDEYITSLIREYEARHPEIKIKWIDVPFDAVIQKLLAACAADKAPDIVNLSSDFLSKFAGFNTLLPIDSIVTKETLDSIYLKNALDDCTFNGKVVAAPWYLNTYAVIYNDSLLRKAGYDSNDVPKAYGSAVNFIREYQKRTGSFATSWNIGKDSYLPMMLESEGLQILDSSFTKAKLDDPRVIAKLSEWISLYRDRCLPGESVITTGASIIEPYQSGRVAFVFTGPVFLKRVRDNAPGIYRNTIVSGPLTGVTGSHELATMALSVMKQTKLPKEAVDFALFVTNSVNQAKFCKLATIYPSSKESFSDQYFTHDDGTPETRARIMGIKLLPSAKRLRYFLKHPRFDELRDVFDEAIQKACLKNITVKAAMEEANRKWNRILAKK